MYAHIYPCIILEHNVYNPGLALATSSKSRLIEDARFKSKYSQRQQLPSPLIVLFCFVQQCNKLMIRENISRNTTMLFLPSLILKPNRCKPCGSHVRKTRLDLQYAEKVQKWRCFYQLRLN